MASQIDIFNLALSDIASKAFVNSLAEDSNERKYCSANFQPAFDALLQDHDWGFASDDDNLALLKSSTDDDPPTVPWIYEYTYPSEAVEVREIIRDNDNEKVVPFKIALDDQATGKVILTDKQSAKARWTRRITNATLLSPKAAIALGWKLATMIVIPLTHNLKLKQGAEQSYLVALSDAKVADFNEGENRKAPDPESIQART